MGLICERVCTVCAAAVNITVSHLFQFSDLIYFISKSLLLSFSSSTLTSTGVTPEHVFPKYWIKSTLGPSSIQHTLHIDTDGMYIGNLGAHLSL